MEFYLSKMTPTTAVESAHCSVGRYNRSDASRQGKKVLNPSRDKSATEGKPRAEVGMGERGVLQQ